MTDDGVQHPRRIGTFGPKQGANVLTVPKNLARSYFGEGQAGVRVDTVVVTGPRFIAGASTHAIFALLFAVRVKQREEHNECDETDKNEHVLVLP